MADRRFKRHFRATLPAALVPLPHIHLVRYAMVAVWRLIVVFPCIQISVKIPHLCRYARALLRDTDAADDLVQDCLERALRKRQLWRRQGSMRSWLFRMLYHVFLNTKGTRRRESLTVPLEAIAPTMAESPRQENYVECRDIAEALARLPEQQYAAIILIALGGLSYDEAAWILGVPVGTLRSRLSRGRETLRTLQAGTRRRETVRRIK